MAGVSEVTSHSFGNYPKLTSRVTRVSFELEFKYINWKDKSISVCRFLERFARLKFADQKSSSFSPKSHTHGEERNGTLAQKKRERRVDGSPLSFPKSTADSSPSFSALSVSTRFTPRRSPTVTCFFGNPLGWVGLGWKHPVVIHACRELDGYPRRPRDVPTPGSSTSNSPNCYKRVPISRVHAATIIALFSKKRKSELIEIWKKKSIDEFCISAAFRT